MYGKVSLLLRAAGLRSTMTGFHYLIKAAILAYEDASYLQHLTKHLYPDVAKAFDVTSMQVEYAMRTAIDVLWNQGNLSELEKRIGYPIKDKPYTGGFIDILIGYLQL